MQGVYRELFKILVQNISSHVLKASFSEALEAKFPTLRNRELLGVSRDSVAMISDLIQQIVVYNERRFIFLVMYLNRTRRRPLASEQF